MSSIADALDTILLRPVDYLHPVRLGNLALCDTPQGRAALNRIVSKRMGGSARGDQDVGLNSKAYLWIRHWSLLPSIASLIGAQLQWPQLARGAALQQLSDYQRAFARVVCGSRANYAIDQSATVEQHVQAAGLNALMAWGADIPAVLTQHLRLQFSPQVIDLQQRMPAQPLNATLFFLAVQHARIHQNAA